MGIFDLKGFDNVHEASTSNEILDSVVEWLDWGLLNKKNYFNVPRGEEDADGNDLSVLRMSTDPRFQPGQAWEGLKPNWVWQELDNSDPPIIPDGIYIDNIFYPLNSSAPFSYHIDYFNGRVVFDTPINPNGVVQVAHSYKWISVHYANSFFGGVKTFESEDSALLSPELIHHLPLIAVEVVGVPRNRGYQLGGGQFMEYLVLFHCIANSETVRDRLMDMVTYQNDKTILTFNTDKASSNNDFPLDENGTPIENAKNYEEMIRTYPRYRVRLQSVSSSMMDFKKISRFGGTVKLTAEVIKTNI